MLRWRLILGAVFISALVALFLLDAWAAEDVKFPPGIVLLALALTVVAAGTREYAALVRTREPDLDRLPLGLGTWLIVASPWLGASAGGYAAQGRWQIGVFTAAVMAVFVREMLRYDLNASRRVTERIALSVLGLAYLGLLPSFLVRLRLLPYGIWPLVMLLVVVKLADVGAYTVGRLVGRHKFVPNLSPGKTWEGLAGGWLFAVGATVPFFCYLEPSAGQAIATGRSFSPYLAFATAIFAFGAAGDLAESLLKRDFQRKDSSTWMPGFGGVLDLIDSPVFAAPVAWAFWEFGWLPS